MIHHPEGMFSRECLGLRKERQCSVLSWLDKKVVKISLFL